MASKIGSPCAVQFRRGDALGAASSLPVPPTTSAMNGAEVCVVGTLTRVTHDWILVTSTDNAMVREYHIPTQAILLVEFQKRVEPSSPPKQQEPTRPPQQAPASAK
ncbi:MAG: hypothetical protein NTU94_07575 [Planctomycetota bacterium]|nr:hypothetical protein [Planctomycetota bacterium]